MAKPTKTTPTTDPKAAPVIAEVEGFHDALVAASAAAQEAGDHVSHGLLAQVQTAVHELRLKIDVIAAQASEEVQALLAEIRSHL